MRDLEKINKMNADDFEGRAANGLIVKDHADFLKRMVCKVNPSWKFNYAMANDVIQADGSADHWVRHSTLDRIDGKAASVRCPN